MRRTPSGALCGNIAMRDVGGYPSGKHPRITRLRTRDRWQRSSLDGHSMASIPSVTEPMKRPRSLKRKNGKGSGLGRSLGMNGTSFATSVAGQRPGLRPEPQTGRAGICLCLRIYSKNRARTEPNQHLRGQGKRGTSRRRGPVSSDAGHLKRTRCGGRRCPRTPSETKATCTGRNQHAVRPETAALGQWRKTVQRARSWRRLRASQGESASR